MKKEIAHNDQKKKQLKTLGSILKKISLEEFILTRARETEKTVTYLTNNCHKKEILSRTIKGKIF